MALNTFFNDETKRSSLHVDINIFYTRQCKPTEFQFTCNSDLIYSYRALRPFSPSNCVLHIFAGTSICHSLLIYKCNMLSLRIILEFKSPASVMRPAFELCV